MKKDANSGIVNALRRRSAMFVRSCFCLILFLLASSLVPQSGLAQRGRGRARPGPRRSLFEQQLRNRGLTERQIRRLKVALGREPSPEGLEAIRKALQKPQSPPLRLSDRFRQTRAYVQWVQTSLNKAIDAGLESDGKFGPKTESAIRRFQRKHRLREDGIVGPETKSKLSSVTRSFPPGLLRPPIRRQRSRIQELVRLDLLHDAVYIDVTRKDGELHVRTWRSALRSAPALPLPERAILDVRRISSVEELEALIPEGRTLIHRGSDFSPEWVHRLKAKHRNYVRVSERSPKTTLGEHARAGELLGRRAELGKTKIFSALPQAQGGRESGPVSQFVEGIRFKRELRRMELRPAEADEWRKLNEEITKVAEESKFPIEVATKEAFLDELQNGVSDYVVLIAHSAKGKIYLPGGKTITTAELSSIQRAVAPKRTVVLVLCGAGTVNAPLKSVAEILLESKMAFNVIAPPDPVSARDVPSLLRRFLKEGETIGEVFNSEDYHSITQVPNEGANTVANRVAPRLPFPVKPLRRSGLWRRFRFVAGARALVSSEAPLLSSIERCYKVLMKSMQYA